MPGVVESRVEPGDGCVWSLMLVLMFRGLGLEPTLVIARELLREGRELLRAGWQSPGFLTFSLLF